MSSVYDMILQWVPCRNQTPLWYDSKIILITRKVKLAFVGGLDLIYILKPYRLSHTGLHSHSLQKPHPTPQHMAEKNFFGRATVSLETPVIQKSWV